MVSMFWNCSFLLTPKTIENAWCDIKKWHFFRWVGFTHFPFILIYLFPHQHHPTTPPISTILNENTTENVYTIPSPTVKRWEQKTLPLLGRFCTFGQETIQPQLSPNTTHPKSINTMMSSYDMESMDPPNPTQEASFTGVYQGCWVLSKVANTVLSMLLVLKMKMMLVSK